jgi:hypothetical protein
MNMKMMVLVVKIVRRKKYLNVKFDKFTKMSITITTMKEFEQLFKQKK